MQVAEVHCVVTPELALARFQQRRRHAGHLDHERDVAAMEAQFAQAAERGPLFPARALSVATHAAVDGQSARRLAVQAAKLAGMDHVAVEWRSG